MDLFLNAQIPNGFSLLPSFICPQANKRQQEKQETGNQEKAAKENSVSAVFIEQKLGLLAHISIKNARLSFKHRSIFPKIPLPFPLEILWQKVAHFLL